MLKYLTKLHDDLEKLTSRKKRADAMPLSERRQWAEQYSKLCNDLSQATENYEHLVSTYKEEQARIVERVSTLYSVTLPNRVDPEVFDGNGYQTIIVPLETKLHEAYIEGDYDACIDCMKIILSSFDALQTIVNQNRQERLVG